MSHIHDWSVVSFVTWHLQAPTNILLFPQNIFDTSHMIAQETKAVTSNIKNVAAKAETLTMRLLLVL
jgi:hypothetical protein